MRVLWFTNCPLRNSDISSTGTWIQPLAEGLLSLNSVNLAVIAFADTSHFKRQDYNEIPQWVVPIREKIGRDGLPSKKLIRNIIEACEWFKPDIVHIWGVELYWGLLTSRKYISYPTLLEMQGLKKACAKYFIADLTVKELIRCIGIKEIIKLKTIAGYRKEYLKWGKYEEEIIINHKFISVQSEWMSAQITGINPYSRQYYVDLMLRQPFYSAKPWGDFNNERIESFPGKYIFISSSGGTIYKGIHVALRAFSVLKKKYPHLRLRVAGDIQKKGLRQDGYVSWLNNLSCELSVEKSVDWLGPLTAEQIINELQYCSANVVCSFVESYCLALAEPMYIGVPCVTAFNGGTSWIAEDGKTALFFQPGDSMMCAHLIDCILKDNLLATNLSNNARIFGHIRNKHERIVKNQLDIYNDVYLSIE
jgi:glycosyltransferase involved in cell wall biosynthesis